MTEGILWCFIFKLYRQYLLVGDTVLLMDKTGKCNILHFARHKAVGFPGLFLEQTYTHFTFAYGIRYLIKNDLEMII